MLIGATGSGKTYIASALTTNACRHGYRADTLATMSSSLILTPRVIQGIYDQEIAARKYSSSDTGRFSPRANHTSDQQRDLLILLRSRDEEKKSTILCQQWFLVTEGWHEQLGSGGVADTILDRLTTNGYEINIDGDVSMRNAIAGFNSRLPTSYAME